MKLTVSAQIHSWLNRWTSRTSSNSANFCAITGSWPTNLPKHSASHATALAVAARKRPCSPGSFVLTLYFNLLPQGIFFRLALSTNIAIDSCYFGRWRCLLPWGNRTRDVKGHRPIFFGLKAEVIHGLRLESF